MAVSGVRSSWETVTRNWLRAVSRFRSSRTSRFRASCASLSRAFSRANYASREE